MGVSEDYENLDGEYDPEVLRAYLGGGYIPSPGMALGLIEEVEWREKQLADQGALIAEQRAAIAVYAKLVRALIDASVEMTNAWADGVDGINERMKTATRNLQEVIGAHKGGE